MKKKVAICFFVLMAFSMTNAQNNEGNNHSSKGAIIRFIEDEYNYGVIIKGGNGDCEFTFVNEGDEPLIISKVKASCGCTTPSYTTQPIMPGYSGKIKVHYNTYNVGVFSKKVTVVCNASNTPRVVLKIKGKVIKEVDYNSMITSPVQQYPVQQYPVQQYPMQQYPVQQYPQQQPQQEQYPPIQNSQEGQQKICSVCNGSGKCRTCNGKGYYTEMGIGSGTHPCPNCPNHSGSCQWCNGTGKQN